MHATENSDNRYANHKSDNEYAQKSGAEHTTKKSNAGYATKMSDAQSDAWLSHPLWYSLNLMIEKCKAFKSMNQMTYISDFIATGSSMCLSYSWKELAMLTIDLLILQ